VGDSVLYKFRAKLSFWKVSVEATNSFFQNVALKVTALAVTNKIQVIGFVVLFIFEVLP
jgi:hypothetical protein